MRKGWYPALIALLLPAAALAQQNPGVQQSGPVTSLHLPAWATQGVLQDAGGAAGSSVFGSGYVTELGITNTGTPFCITNTLLSSQSGYYQTCLGANATILGETGSFITFNAYGGAAQLPLIFEINGTNYQFPGNGQGNILGPDTSTVNEPMVWANSSGTLAKDGLNAPISHTGSFAVIGATDMEPTDATLSSLNALYFPTYSQEAGTRDILALTAPVSDSTGSFRDTLYVQNSDSDITTYTMQHTDYAGRYAAFGPNNSGTWQSSHKNHIGFSAYGIAANSSDLVSGFLTGAGGVFGEAFQYGAGIGDNEFAAHNPSAANGGIAQAGSLVGVQGIIDSSFADVDGTHTAFAFLATNTGAQLATAAFGSTSSDGSNYLYWLYGGSAVVTQGAIVMPREASDASCQTGLSTIIDYGTNNGTPAGGSYTNWACGTNGGQYRWIDAGVVVASLDTNRLQLGSTTPVHLGFAQTTPPALTSCGTSPDDVGATDASGTVTMGTGTPTGCVITFTTAYASAPHCVVTWRGTPLASQSYAISNTAITLTQTATSSNLVDYVCTARNGG